MSLNSHIFGCWKELSHRSYKSAVLPFSLTEELYLAVMTTRAQHCRTMADSDVQTPAMALRLLIAKIARDELVLHVERGCLRALTSMATHHLQFSWKGRYRRHLSVRGRGVFLATCAIVTSRFRSSTLLHDVCLSVGATAVYTCS